MANLPVIANGRSCPICQIRTHPLLMPPRCYQTVPGETPIDHGRSLCCACRYLVAHREGYPTVVSSVAGLLPDRVLKAGARLLSGPPGPSKDW